MDILDFTLDHLITLDDIIDLQQRGIDLLILNDGHSALHNVSYLCKSDIIEYFLSLGVDPNQRNYFGITPIMAVFDSPYFNVDAVKVLLKYGASLDALDNDGLSIEDYARSNILLNRYVSDINIEMLSGLYKEFYDEYDPNDEDLWVNEILKDIDDELEEIYSDEEWFNRLIVLRFLKDTREVIRHILDFIKSNGPIHLQYLRAWTPHDYGNICKCIENKEYIKSIKMIIKHVKGFKTGWFYYLLPNLILAAKEFVPIDGDIKDIEAGIELMKVLFSNTPFDDTRYTHEITRIRD